MVWGRAVLGPVIALASVRFAYAEIWLGIMIAAGFFSDVYDGFLARRWGSETSALRIADSIADTVFYLGILAAVIASEWPALQSRLWLMTGLLLLEILRWLFDWSKFRRMASYHSYASKLWGILLAAAAIALLCFHGAFWLLTLALAWGIACDLEGLAMSIVLPVWTRDVKTIRHAFVIRNQLTSARNRPKIPPPHLEEKTEREIV